MSTPFTVFFTIFLKLLNNMVARGGVYRRRVLRSTVHAVVLEPLTCPVAAPTPTSSSLRSRMLDPATKLELSTTAVCLNEISPRAPYPRRRRFPSPLYVRGTSER